MTKPKIIKKAVYPGFTRVIVEALGHGGGKFYHRAKMRVVTIKAGTEYYRANGFNVLSIDACFEFNALAELQRQVAIEQAIKKMVELENAMLTELQRQVDIAKMIELENAEFSTSTV